MHTESMTDDQSRLALELANLFDSQSLHELTGELRDEITRCRERNYNEEGIEMFLVLEDLEAGPAPRSGSPLDNALLAITARLAMWAQEEAGAAADDPGPAEIAAAFEVLARRCFSIGSDRAPDQGADRG